MTEKPIYLTEEYCRKRAAKKSIKTKRPYVVTKKDGCFGVASDFFFCTVLAAHGWKTIAKYQDGIQI